MRLLKMLLVAFITMIVHSIVRMMSNTNMDYLYPEFWAQSFESLNVGEYNLQNLISRNFEGQIANYGQKINVPLQVDFSDADAWAPGDSITATGITQTEAEVSLDKSYKKTINLTAKDLSLSPYDLISNYGEGMAKSLLLTLNKQIYIAALGSKYFIDASAGISEDFIVNAGTMLSSNEVTQIGRKCVASPDVMGALKKVDAFMAVDTSGNQDIMKEGLITRRMGFDFYENNAISKYTPADVTGACASATAGASTIVVTGFNDDTAPIRIGDKVTIESDSVIYTVTSTILTTGDTTTIGIYPALGTTISASKVVTITPVQSALCFVPSAMALAARSYGALPEGVGVRSAVSDHRGMPVRFSVWHDGNLGLQVQADILFGVKLVHPTRMVRVIEDL
jgi:hypothetical protein